MVRTRVAVALLAAVATGATQVTGQAGARSFATIKNTSPPVVTGTARVGSTLTTTHGNWSWSPPSLNKAKFAFSWYRCNALGNHCHLIVGATKRSYAPANLDVGHTIRSHVVISLVGYPSAKASSHQTAVVKAKALVPYEDVIA
jgi:hypothetical protein